jgi:hypothetical protein
MYVKVEEIVAFIDDEGRHICVEHMTDEEWDALTSDNFLTIDDVRDTDSDLYFCDRCGERIVEF